MRSNNRVTARGFARRLATVMSGICLAVTMLALPAQAASGPAPATGAPRHSPNGGEFLSPSGNISCEIDNGYVGLHQVYCQTFSPPRSVTMFASGMLKKCSGDKCLGNPADGTPTLAYGTWTESGPFRCLSATDGVTCTTSGRGFRISRSGITAVSPGS
jgi:hypothetical protein